MKVITFFAKFHLIFSANANAHTECNILQPPPHSFEIFQIKIGNGKTNARINRKKKKTT